MADFCVSLVRCPSNLCCYNKSDVLSFIEEHSEESTAPGWTVSAERTRLSGSLRAQVADGAKNHYQPPAT